METLPLGNLICSSYPSLAKEKIRSFLFPLLGNLLCYPIPLLKFAPFKIWFVLRVVREASYCSAKMFSGQKSKLNVCIFCVTELLQRSESEEKCISTAYDITEAYQGEQECIHTQVSGTFKFLSVYPKTWLPMSGKNSEISLGMYLLQDRATCRLPAK